MSRSMTNAESREEPKKAGSSRADTAVSLFIAAASMLVSAGCLAALLISPWVNIVNVVGVEIYGHRVGVDVAATTHGAARAILIALGPACILATIVVRLTIRPQRLRLMIAIWVLLSLCLAG